MLSILLTAMLSKAARAELVSTGVGMIGRRTVTSREVQIRHLVDVALADKLDRADLRNVEVDSRAFAVQARDTLLEHVVALEAQNFNLMQILPEDLARAKRQAQSVLGTSPAWNSLHVDPREFEDEVRRKLQARRFVKFRQESSTLPVTDGEIVKSFEENRAKYGNVSLDRAREKIKSSLGRVLAEKRLKDWYESLMGKYAVKNLIAEM